MLRRPSTSQTMNTRIASSATLLVVAAGFAFALDPAALPPTTTSQSAASNTVTVSATGKVVVDATYLKMATAIKGNAEVAGEAIANFAQARTRTLSGLQGSDLDGLELVSKGLEIDHMEEPETNQMNGFVTMGAPGGAETPKPGVTCSESIELRFRPAGDAQAQRAQAAQAIDLALELGLALETKSVANPYFFDASAAQASEGTLSGQLSVESKAAAESAAQAAAMDRARALAKNLAELSGRKLGGVSSVTLSSLATKWNGIGAGVQVSAELAVTFELER